MPRIARVVAPGLPHHVTQRGVRSMDVFDDANDRELYVSLMRQHGEGTGLEFLAWCLMSNHVHLIVVPRTAESLARGVGNAHKAYTRAKNFSSGARGYLFQGRFGSCVLDEPHLFAAARYAELNPVAAGIVDTPEEYEWSSAAFHLKEAKRDLLVSDRTMLGLVHDWRALLQAGMDEMEARELERALSTGRSLWSAEFVEGLEKRYGRQARPAEAEAGAER
jgi:putative transposase